MSDFYSRMQATADRLIKQYGKPQPGVLTRQQISKHDKVLNAVIEDQPLTTPITIVVLPASKGTVEAFDNRIKNGTIGLSRIRFVVASAFGVTFEPEPKDTLTFEGENWEVLGCTPVKPGDTAIVYKMGVMK